MGVKIGDSVVLTKRPALQGNVLSVADGIATVDWVDSDGLLVKKGRRKVFDISVDEISVTERYKVKTNTNTPFGTQYTIIDSQTGFMPSGYGAPYKTMEAVEKAMKELKSRMADGGSVDGNFANGGAVGRTYRLMPYKDMSVPNMIEPIYEKAETFTGDYDDAIAKAQDLLKSNAMIVQVNINRLGKTALASKKAAVVSSKGVTRFEDGGVIEEHENKWGVVKEQVKFAVVRAVGFDTAFRYKQRNYVISPYSLLEWAVYKNMLNVKEINEKVFYAAVSEADSVEASYRDSGEGIGSSDMNSFIKSFLDDADLKTDWINHRLQRIDADGDVLIIVNELPSRTMFADGGSVSGWRSKELEELNKWYADKKQEAESDLSDYGWNTNSRQYERAIATLDKVKNVTTKLINSEILKGGEYRYSYNFRITKDGYADADVLLDRDIVLDNPANQTEAAEQRAKYRSVFSLDGFIAGKLGELTKPILGFPLCSEVGYSQSGERVGMAFKDGGLINNQALKNKFFWWF